MFRPSSDTCVDVTKMASDMDSTIKEIIAVHAISGCDTVPSLSSIGKTKLLKLLLKDSNASVKSDLLKFYKTELDDIDTVGFSVMLALYFGNIDGM